MATRAVASNPIYWHSSTNVTHTFQIHYRRKHNSVVVPIGGVAAGALRYAMETCSSRQPRWSRWVFGVWAVVTAAWLVMATLMLVQTWPETSVERDGVAQFGDATDDLVFGRPFEGLTHVRASPVTGGRLARFLLLAAIPPAFLFVLCCVGLWIAGLPFPYSRQERKPRWRSFDIQHTASSIDKTHKPRR